MNPRTLLAGTSACALAAMLAFGAAPVAAQTYGTYGSDTNPPQYSTPAEQEQTRQLNQQAVSGTTRSPAVLNGEAQAPPAQGPQTNYGNPSTDNYAGEPGAPDQTAPTMPPQQTGSPQANGYYGNPQAPSSPQGYGGDNGGASQQQYEGQVQRYGEQQQEYQRQNEQYREESARYRANLRAYDLAMYDWAYPAPIAYHYDGGLEPLYLVAEPSQQLFQIPVEDPGGRWVGRVRNIDTAPDGRPARVEVALNRRVSVWVQPGDLRYDPYSHVLFTDLSRGQLWQMPGATVESGPM